MEKFSQKREWFGRVKNRFGSYPTHIKHIAGYHQNKTQLKCEETV